MKKDGTTTVEEVEQTSQSQKLGKSILLCKKEKSQAVVGKVDRQARKFFECWIEEDEKVERLSHPRRPNVLAVDKNHEAYLAQVEIASRLLNKGKEEEIVEDDQQIKRKERQDRRLAEALVKNPGELMLKRLGCWRT